jgi:hypothetical protein
MFCCTLYSELSGTSSQSECDDIPCVDLETVFLMYNTGKAAMRSVCSWCHFYCQIIRLQYLGVGVGWGGVRFNLFTYTWTALKWFSKSRFSFKGYNKEISVRWNIMWFLFFRHHASVSSLNILLCSSNWSARFKIAKWDACYVPMTKAMNCS